MAVVPHPPNFFLVPRLKIKLKGRHFNTIEVIGAESQAVLNTLREHYCQDAFTNDRSAGNDAYGRKRTTLMVMVASRLLGWILERWDGVMWTGLVCLRMGTGGELL
jgi:hypothetical protein